MRKTTHQKLGKICFGKDGKISIFRHIFRLCNVSGQISLFLL